MPLAHILSPTNVPGFVPWLTALCLFGGALGALVFWGDHTRRLALGAVACAGLAGSAAVYLTQPPLPLRPGYGIDLSTLDGATVQSSVRVQVCSAGTGSTPAPVPGPGRLLLIRVDGAQAAETRSSTVALAVPRGRHVIDAALITSDHRAFTPPITSAATITVSGPGPLGPPQPCAAR